MKNLRNPEKIHIQQLHYISQLDQLAERESFPPFERLFYLDVIHHHLQLFVERFWLEITESTISLSSTESIVRMLQVSSTRVIEIIDEVNAKGGPFKFILEPTKEKKRALLQALVSTQAISPNDFLSAKPYVCYQGQYYEPETLLEIEHKANGQYVLYPIPMVLADEISLCTLYRHRVRKFDDMSGQEEIIRTCRLHPACGQAIAFQTTDTRLPSNPSVTTWQAPPASFISWSCLINRASDDAEYRFSPTKKRAPVAIAQRHTDSLLHFPFNHFEDVVRLVEAALNGGQVAHIIWTVYRVKPGGLMEQLFTLVLQHKIPLTLIVEVKASYEECSNSALARRLQAQGAAILYSSNNKKNHAKWALIQFKPETEPDISLISTGNWHEDHAKTYVDFVLVSCNKLIARDLLAMYRFLKRDIMPTFECLLVTPFNLYHGLTRKIQATVQCAGAGQAASIFLKANDLSYTPLIKQLEAARRAGVMITLCIRTCCLLFDGDGVVTSRHVGRFLEHFRLMVFQVAGEKREIYLGSGDFKARNFNRRYEVFVPVLDNDVQAYMEKVIELYTDARFKQYSYQSLQHDKLHPGQSIHDWLQDNYEWL